MGIFLGIDVGTSGVKAALINEAGSLLAQATAPLSVARPQPGWSEQNPFDWWSATQSAVLALPPNLRSGVSGVGLAGQMHGATLLGPDDIPLRPAILWNDGRSFVECAELEQLEPGSREITGNIAMPGFTAPKLLWVRRHEPAVFGRVNTVLLPKDFVRLCMTGERASDLSDSSGTLWLDVAARRWSGQMLAACGLAESQMPLLYEGCEIAGHLRADTAAAWGMNRVVPVVGGAGDNAAGAAGVGVIDDGQALLSLGTSGVLFVATSTFMPNPARAVHAFCHCLPATWHQMAVHLSAASCIDWAVRLTGLEGPAELFNAAERVGAGAGPELFLPYLSGERTPHNNPHVRGAFLGIDHDTDAQRLAAAVLEGVAFAHADGLAALRDAGAHVDKLTVIGGGARSRYWGSILAASMDVQLLYIEGGEVGPALGAARLALMAVTGTTAAEACARPPVSQVVDPDPALAARLAPKLARFRAAYAGVSTL